MSDGGFYRAFEERHRGSRELISSRQAVYLPYIKPLLDLWPVCPAIDIGCGRGEWLEIIVSCGFAAQGVDLDEGMLAACKELGLPANQADALGHLATIESESQALVSGFHIAEHIPFQDLQLLVSEALRVLMPGGILILETPNSENIAVGTSSFYLDPTHERPIPHLLLSFLTEYTGFSRSKLLRLQEPPQLHDPDYLPDLLAVLTGVSPDYAIVAQKAASPGILESFDRAFETVHGLSLADLAIRYDQKLDTDISALKSETRSQAEWANLIEKELDEIRIRYEIMEDRARLAEAAIKRLSNQFDVTQNVDQDAENGVFSAGKSVKEGRLAIIKSAARDSVGTPLQVDAYNTNRSYLPLDRVNDKKIKILEVELENQRNKILRCEEEKGQGDFRYRELEAHVIDVANRLSESQENAQYWNLKSIELERRLAEILGSRSWKLTGPIRLCVRAISRLIQAPRKASKDTIYRVGRFGMSALISQPTLFAWLVRFVKRMPWLHSRLRNLLDQIRRSPNGLPASHATNESMAAGEEGLTKRANKILRALEYGDDSRKKH